MKATLVGRFASLALQTYGEGAVVAASRQGVCVELEAGLVVVGGPDMPPGPLCLRLEARPPAGLLAGPVRSGSGHLRVGDLDVDWSQAAVWCGRLPDPTILQRTGRRLAQAVAAFAAESPLLSPPYVAYTCDFRRRLRTGQLADAAQVIAGVGPGLTPAGDDLLAGSMFWLRAARGAPVEPALSKLAGAAATTSLSRAFLRSAAGGQWLEPAHIVMQTLAESSIQATVSAARRLAGVGGSSGRDFCLGLMWAAQQATLLADTVDTRHPTREPSDAGLASRR